MGIYDIRDMEPHPPDDSGGFCCVSAGMHMGHDEDCLGYNRKALWDGALDPEYVEWGLHRLVAYGHDSVESAELEAWAESVVGQLKYIQARLEAARSLKHTHECLEYAAQTGRAFCIVECMDIRRAARAELSRGQDTTGC